MTHRVADIWASSLPIDSPHEPTSTARAQTEYGSLSGIAESGGVDPDDIALGPAMYPPVLGSLEFCGYIKDKTGFYCPRNIGRSISIHHEVYYIFGDTVCKDAAGNSVGLTSNTIAYVDDRTKFLESEYKEILYNKMVKDFVPLNEAEIAFETEHPGAHIVFSMTGGAVDIGLVGVVLFQASVVYANGVVEYVGVFLALLTTYGDGRIVVERHPWRIFGPNEPRMGSLSTLCYKRYIYLWSHRGDGQIILARVADVWTAQRQLYRYWSGSAWVPSWQDAQPILHGIQHGAVIHTELFGKDKPFVFVGVNQQRDSMVQIGAAANIQGPFHLTPVCEAIGILYDSSPKHYIYPHLFASDIPKRELMVTWSEQSPNGGVIAAKLKFKIDWVAAVKEAEERQRAAEEQEWRRRAMEEQQAYLARMVEEEELFDDYGLEYYGPDSEGKGLLMEKGYMSGR